MSNNDADYQAKLAVEHISSKNCAGCKFYIYGSNDQVCLFHSEPIEHCALVQLDIQGKLNNETSIKVRDKRSNLSSLI